MAFLTSSYRVVYFCLFIQLDHLAGFHQDQPHTHLDPTQGLAIVSEFCVWFIAVSGQLAPWTICPRQLAPDLQTNGCPIWKHLCYFGQIYFYAQKVITSWKKKKVCFFKIHGFEAFWKKGWGWRNKILQNIKHKQFDLFHFTYFKCCGWITKWSRSCVNAIVTIEGYKRKS